ncbi:MAG: conserved rane protein of unknown function [Firmicutes bacterium]|nr:conserved rane protein of unknown function [Bacillota bacterium]
MFTELTIAHPYLMGFAKFAVLATIGELLAIRIVGGHWKTPPGLVYRSAVWGFLGMGIVLMFEIFFAGTASALSKGLLYSGNGVPQPVFQAVFTSAIMNLTFAPTFMAFHRFTDTTIDMVCGEGRKIGDISLAEVTNRIDWQGFVSFVVLKTIPFFWIPAHAVTFLLPPEYRILVAASLSIALGAILAYAKRKNK